jgi:serine/threonine protein phosphatase PrpC
VIAIPEITYHRLGDHDNMIIICSDGVWEFLSNKTVMDMVSPLFKDKKAEKACELLVVESVRQWKMEDDVVDDITALCVFL